MKHSSGVWILLISLSATSFAAFGASLCLAFWDTSGMSMAQEAAHEKLMFRLAFMVGVPALAASLTVTLFMWKNSRFARRQLCRFCGYSKRGLTSGVCPECGRRFDG